MNEVEDLRKLLKGTEAELEDAETKITVLNDVLSMTRRANVAFQAREKDRKEVAAMYEYTEKVNKSYGRQLIWAEGKIKEYRTEIARLRVAHYALLGNVMSSALIVDCELEKEFLRQIILDQGVVSEAREKEKRSFTRSATGRVSRLERTVSDRDEIIQNRDETIRQLSRRLANFVTPK